MVRLGAPGADLEGRSATWSRSRATCCVVERLPTGTSRDEALPLLGEPDERTTSDGGRETWQYCRYLDEHRYAFAQTLVTFESGRLVDWMEYRYL